MHDLVHTLIIHTTTHAGIVPMAGIDNPLDGILPDFTVFGAKFTAWWQKLLGALWAIAILVTIGFLIWGIAKMGKADDGNPGVYRQGQQAAKAAGIALCCEAALTVIVGAILAIASA